MQLSDCELLPGVIVDTVDPLKLGRIKCVIPGYVDPKFSNENMPWVRPLGMTRHQSFSKMMKGYKVWILVNKLNYNEFWYFPFFEFNDVAKEFLDATYDDEQPEIFMAHNNGGNHAVSVYDEANGFTTKIGEHHIELHPEGKVSLQGAAAKVELENSKIKIGADGDWEPAVLGNKLVEILSGLKDALSELHEKCNGIHGCLSAPVLNAVLALNPIDEIKSKNVSIN